MRAIEFDRSINLVVKLHGLSSDDIFWFNCIASSSSYCHWESKVSPSGHKKVPRLSDPVGAPFCDPRECFSGPGGAPFCAPIGARFRDPGACFSARGMIISSEKRREIRDSFNEDETVFLVNTSFSSVTNSYDLKVSLSNRIREIKAICAHFELDFERLSSGGGNGCSGLDESIIESKVQDHSDSVAESGSDKTIDVDLTLFLERDIATSFPSHVPAVSADYAYPTSCPIALNEFNEKAFELNFLELVDKFPMEEGSFIRFAGRNPFCSASITVLNIQFASI